MGIVSYLIFFAIVVSILSIITLGLNLQWGSTGVFNAGVVGFYAVGGYTYAILTAPGRPELLVNLELPWILGVVGALIASAIAALLVGLATMKLRGDYLAIATFGIAVTIQLIALNWEGLTGGSLGMTSVPRPLSGFFETPFTYNVFYLCLSAGFCLLTYWALERIVRSPWGRVLRAIREDEGAAIALGKDAATLRLQAFVLGSTVMGLAGALYVGFIGFVSPFDFVPIITFQIWTMLIVGGSGNNKGAVLGTLVVWGLWSASGTLISKILPAAFQTQGGAVQTILIGLVLVLTLLFKPGGLIGEEPTTSRHAG
ncbi:branched-chain amino acid ABC transporter permease [Microvirga antarctica]|uniref:branched-chain amino acid ABC transporter permease n=1 Tax=Microvirga antarctica TaxID=2819233 RepID=UPI001B300BFF|nr:branched-chain amino acid ABC transporter permease [Microvirga antarctica]